MGTIIQQCLGKSPDYKLMAGRGWRGETDYSVFRGNTSDSIHEKTLWQQTT